MLLNESVGRIIAISLAVDVVAGLFDSCDSNAVLGGFALYSLIPTYLLVTASLRVA